MDKMTPQSPAATAPISGEPLETAQTVSLAGEQLAVAIREIMGPVMAQISDILRRNSEAMERFAAQQQAVTARIEDLEKQIRLKTPLSKSQERCVNDAIRLRARELLALKSVDDKKAVTKLASAIRKSVLCRYGVSSLREAPGYDYDVAMQHVRGWNDMLMVRDIAREAKAREDNQGENRGRNHADGGMDG